MNVSVSTTDTTSLGGVVHPRNNYKYRPLKGKDEIRILVFNGLAGDNKLKFTLEHQSLSDLNEFHALSYHWGSSLKTRSIICDGASMGVTENLHAALEELACVLKEEKSSMNFKGSLWVDAICINQDDIHEKQKQIPLMGKIYSTARGVIAWVGDGENRSTKSKKNSIIDILKCSRWFERMWVIQEVILAREIEVVAKDAHYSWRYLVMVDIANDLPPDDVRKSRMSNVKTMRELRNKYRRKGVQSPGWLLELMDRTKNFQVTDERDHLYALYGLIEKINFPVNYNSDYTYAEMTADFVRWALEEIPGLALLSYARGGIKCRCVKPCPSWTLCPSTQHNKNKSSLLTKPELYTFGPNHKALLKIEENRYLRLMGTIVDTVDIIDHNSSSDGDNDDYSSDGDINEYLSFPSEFPDSTKVVDPSSHRFERLYAAIELEPISQEWAHNGVAEAQKSHRPRGSKTESAIRSIRSRVKSYVFRNSGHSLEITKTDRFAWLPPDRAKSSKMHSRCAYTEPGDKICIFHGGHIPYVIRPQKDGTYTLVGECWIEGFMGEKILTMPEYKFDMITLV